MMPVTRHSTAAPSYKARVQDFYDRLSPHFRELWGEHLHDGYYRSGNESKEEAQDLLVEHLAGWAEVPRDADGLDIGCGMGATSLWLARHRNARMTGITLSPRQREIACELAAREQIAAEFLVADADTYEPPAPFDFTWMVGVLGHFEDQRAFLRRAARFLRPGGLFVLADWVADPFLSQADRHRYVEPVLAGMLMPTIATLDSYVEWLEESGFEVLRSADLTRETLPTWTEGVSILDTPGLARLAWEAGRDALNLITAVKGMRLTMSRGMTRYGALAAQRR